MSENSPAPVSALGPRCAHLRTKAMYIPEFAAGAFTEAGNGEEENPDVVCWCNRTGGEIGPDREPAAHAMCRDTARECYRATVVYSA